MSDLEGLLCLEVFDVRVREAVVMHEARRLAQIGTHSGRQHRVLGDSAHLVEPCAHAEFALEWVLAKAQWDQVVE